METLEELRLQSGVRRWNSLLLEKPLPFPLRPSTDGLRPLTVQRGTCFAQRLLSQVLIMFLKISIAMSNHCLVQCVDTIFILDRLTRLMGRGLLCFLRPGTCISISLGIQLSGKGFGLFLKTNKQKTMLWLGCHSVVQHLPMHATYKNKGVNNKQ